MKIIIKDQIFIIVGNGMIIKKEVHLEQVKEIIYKALLERSIIADDIIIERRL